MSCFVGLVAEATEPQPRANDLDRSAGRLAGAPRAGVCAPRRVAPDSHKAREIAALSQPHNARHLAHLAPLLLLD